MGAEGHGAAPTPGKPGGLLSRGTGKQPTRARTAAQRRHHRKKRAARGDRFLFQAAGSYLSCAEYPQATRLKSVSLDWLRWGCVHELRRGSVRDFPADPRRRPPAEACACLVACLGGAFGSIERPTARICDSAKRRRALAMDSSGRWARRDAERRRRAGSHSNSSGAAPPGSRRGAQSGATQTLPFGEGCGLSTAPSPKLPGSVRKTSSPSSRRFPSSPGRGLISSGTYFERIEDWKRELGLGRTSVSLAASPRMPDQTPTAGRDAGAPSDTELATGAREDSSQPAD